MCGLPTTCQVELMVVVTICFKFPNGSIEIMIVWCGCPLCMLCMLFDYAIRDGHGFYRNMVLLQFD
jgi:hypothetical protein